MEDERRRILTQVAEGTLSPQEAAARLDELTARSAGPAVQEPPARAATRIRVVRTAGPAEVVGDESVREAVADGPHTVRREGDTLVVDGSECDEPGAGFWFSRSDRQRFNIGFGSVQRPLVVRVNPTLPLEVSVQAGSLRVRGVRGPISGTVQAGSTTIDGFEGPLELAVQAGSIKASGRILEGQSHVRCEAGSVRLQLSRDSSVRVSARSTLGRVSMDGETGDTDAWVLGGGSHEAVIGTGAASLEIEATMGSVRVARA